MKITAIIPLRITDGVYEARERLNRIIKNVPKDKYDILIVDYGTPDTHLELLAGIEEDGVDILRVETASEIFSIGQARDLGVQYAKNKVVIFNDIDFYGNTQMYNNIYDEVCSRRMDLNIYDFFCVPVFFLTEEGSNYTISLSGDAKDTVANNIIHRKIYESDKDFVDFPAYGSSAIVVNKHHYLAIGGHSQEFYGHGAEDYDVLHRLSAYYAKGPRTAEYYLNTKSNDIKEYRGYRAYFSLYGIDVFNKGIFFQHLWHPKRSIPGYHQTQRNFSLLEGMMKRFDLYRDQPFPLSDYNNNNNNLILINSAASTFKAIRHVFPVLGRFSFLCESTFTDSNELLLYIQKNSIDNVFFLNPYGNQHRLSLYEAVKTSNINYIVFDRGALPDSWFFDHNGFNYDSASYSISSWQRDLNKEEKESVKNYIFNLRNSEETLEFNSPRKSGRFYKEQYQVGNRKVLFIPFQRPSDTVTTYFAGAAESVSGFQEWVKYLADTLPKSEWLIVCKNHPLEKNLPKIENVIYADDDTHIHDLIELSDKVLLMNSGVGLISLAFMKPVICASNSFYAHEGLAVSAKDKSEVIELINSDIIVDEDKLHQFYWHLINKVYSFGNSKYRKTKAKDGTERNIVIEILFSSINLRGQNITLGQPPKGITLDAPLFASFGGRNGIKNLLKPPSKTQLKKPAPVAQVVDKTKEPIKKSAEIINFSQEKEKKNISEGTKQKSFFSRKIKKLVRSPRLFFKDAIVNKKSRQLTKDAV